MIPQDPFDALSPLDSRYWDQAIAQFLSENGFTRYKLRVELALIKTLVARGLCPPEAIQEVEQACADIQTSDVYEEEQRVHHDLRALVNCIRHRVSDGIKPFIHLTATSYDIVDTANAARFKDAIGQVLIPALMRLEEVLINITLREARTVQVGRTHGQHAVPVTFGFALASYVSRLGGCIEELQIHVAALVGKFSGAVGAYNASSLLFQDPDTFEREVLSELGIAPAEVSTQIVPREAMTRLLCEVTIVAGVLANLSDDMRHLQRTEIAEVGEVFERNQVGSSTMPQKRNPINFENAKSLWKIVMPRMITVFMDQISEHQRDLTNSASTRTYGEVIAYVVSTANRLTKTMQGLVVDHESLVRNLAVQRGMVLAEPLYVILACLGHPDAHEKVRVLTLQAEQEGRTLQEIVQQDTELAVYVGRMTDHQRRVFTGQTLYIGMAAEKAEVVAQHWRQRFDLKDITHC